MYSDPVAIENRDAGDMTICNRGSIASGTYNFLGIFNAALHFAGAGGFTLFVNPGSVDALLDAFFAYRSDGATSDQHRRLSRRPSRTKVDTPDWPIVFSCRPVSGRKRRPKLRNL